MIDDRDSHGNAGQTGIPISRASDDGRLSDLRETGSDVVAIVEGQVVDELPADLYIPPHALEIFLETFEGPLDLLLYLIRRQNLEILSIRVAEITEQYMRYIELMSALELTLAGEYLVMAATLAEIKSRMLLPRVTETEDENDPRSELIRRLQEYDRIKVAAEGIAQLPRLERDTFLARAMPPELIKERSEPVVDMKALMLALSDVLHRADLYERHAVQMEPLSVRERMSNVLEQVSVGGEFVPFGDLFSPVEGRRGVIVTFLALMELCREGLVDLLQHEAYAPIYVKTAGM